MKEQKQIKLFDWQEQASRVSVDTIVSLPKVVVSLFEVSGFATLYYRLNGYRVIQIDEKLGHDIMTWNYEAIDNNLVCGIMAFPPCTHFSVSGAQYWSEKDEDGRTAESVKLVEKTLEIVNYFEPDWWFLENPVGRIAKLVPELQNYGPFYFHPYEYGDPWKKKTALYGKFKPPGKNPVKPILMKKFASKSKKQGYSMYSWTHWAEMQGKDKRAELRSYTPLGFAKAFYEANSKAN